jgi:hypothetical protein
MRHFRPVLLFALLIGSAACGDSGSTTPGANDDEDDDTPVVDLDPTPDPNGDNFCGRLGYHCTPTQAPAGSLARSDTLLTTVKARVEGGESNAAAATWLRDQRDVVEAASTEGSVVFRVEGAPPTWLLTPQLGTGGSPAPPTVQTTRQEVVGHGTSRDNSQKRKRALLLAPYQFQFAGNDPTAAVQQILRGARDYNHSAGTNVVQNTAAPAQPPSGSSLGQPKLADFQGWDAYDVIMVTSHGAEMGASSFGCTFFSDFLTCITGVSTGERVASCADIANLYPNIPGVRCAGTSGVPGTFILLDTDFFAAQYSVFAAGLDKAIVFMGGCQTFKNSSLAFNLAGSRSEYFGWDESVYVSEMGPPAIRLFQLLVQDGLTTEDAFDKLQSEGLDNTTKADLKHYSNGDGLHVREITTLKNPLAPSVSGGSSPLAGVWPGGPLSPVGQGDLNDGDILPFLGQAGDGTNDELFFYVDVDGVKPGDEGEIDVEVEVDGNPVGTWALTGNDARRIDDSTVRVRIRQPLDFDVQQGQTVLLKANAQLPGDGESEHEVPIALQNPVLHFESTIESTASDLLQRSRVEGDIELALKQGDDPDELELTSSIGPLRYLEYSLEVPSSSGCSVTTATIDGRFEVKEGRVELDPTSSNFGIPEELVLILYPEIKDSSTLTCPGGSQTTESIYWFAGWVSFHGGALGGPSELDQARGGFVIRDWQPGTGAAWARREYDRSGMDAEVTFMERTLMELRGPTYTAGSGGAGSKR